MVKVRNLNSIPDEIQALKLKRGTEIINKHRNLNKINFKKRRNFMYLQFKNFFNHKISNIFFICIFIVLYIPKILSKKQKSNLRHLIYDCEIIMTSKEEISEELLVSPLFVQKSDLHTLDEETLDGETIYKATIKWNNELANCSHMFYNLSNIIMLDFSNFNFMGVVNMSNMFGGCKNLKQINFGNSKISRVLDMNSLFYDCNSLLSLDLSTFDTSSVTTMENIFYGCSSITTFDLSSFKANNLINIAGMFSSCSSLEYFNWTYFDTTLITNTARMFNGCTSLISLDLSKLKTQNDINMEYMFNDCTNLEYLTFSSFFITNPVKNMSHMFSGCTKLQTLDLSNFMTASVMDMESMFENCENLLYLKLSNFNTAMVDNMKKMFYGCSSLIFLNLYSNVYIEKNGLILDDIFTGTSNDLIYCVHDISSKIKNILSSKSTQNDCSNKCFSEDNNLIYKNACYRDCPEGTYISSDNKLLCVDLNCEYYYSYDKTSCATKIEDGYYLKDEELKILGKCHIDCKTCIKGEEEDNTNCLICKDNNKYFDSGNCVDECKNDFYINELGNKICTCSYDIKCKECSTESINPLALCISCNNGYYSKKDENYNNSFVNCYKDLEGYYLFDNYYYPCYSSCKKCSEKGDIDNHNCDECKEGYIIIPEINKEKNCYKKCDFYYYIDSSNEYKCTEAKECPPEYNKLIRKENKCIDECNKEKNFQFEYKNECYNACPIDTLEDNYICKEKEYYTEKITDEKIISISEINFNEDITTNDETNTNKKTEISVQSDTLEKIDIQQTNDNIKTDLNKNTNINKIEITNSDFNFETEINKSTELIKKTDIIFKTDFIELETTNKEKETTNKEIETTNKEIETSNKEIETTNKEIETTNKIEDKIIDTTNKEIEITNKIADKIIETTNKEIEITYKITDQIIETNNEKEENEESSKNKRIDIIDNLDVEKFFYGLYNSTELSILNKDDIIKSIKQDIISHNIDSLLSNVTGGEKKDILIKEDKVLYQITTTDNQNSNQYNNVSTIKLGECEDILKEVYGIDKNQSLIIFKVDYYMEGLLIPIIGYEVYEPKNKTKLDLSLCNKTSINYNIPVSINEDNLFKYDPNSEYYNDECNTYTTEDGTDILINDRQEEFVDNNMSLCENICTYVGYNSTNKKAICECGIKYQEFLIEELNNQNNLLSADFTSIDSDSNFATMKCYEVLFTKDGLITNIGSYILLFIFLILVISAIIFWKVGNHLLETHINNILHSKGMDRLTKKRKSSNKIKINKKSKVKKNNVANPQKKIMKKSSKKVNSFNKKENSVNSKVLLKLKPNKEEKMIITHKSEKKIKKLKKKVFVDYVINHLSYKEALIYDKRTYLEYYISLLRTKHPIFFTFCFVKDYNILIIKICISLLSFTVYLAINALFFNNTIIHKIYLNEGKYDIVSVLPRIFLSFVISHIINIIFRICFLSERELYFIEKQETLLKAKKKSKSVKFCFSIKYFIFFIFSLIFLILLWYYLASFCAIYQNSQVFVLLNTIISCGISLIYPFFINLIPGIFRMYSLNSSNNNRDCIYIFSRILQIV